MPTTQSSGIHSSNRVAVRRVKETAWGETPSSPALTEMRNVDANFELNIQKGTSNEVRSDRMVASQTARSASASGSVNGEISFAAYDDEIESALASAFGTLVDLSGTDIAATGTGFSSSTTDFSGIEVGQWIGVRGFATDSINGFYKCTAVTANSITTENAPAATESAGETVTVKGKMIRNAQALTSFTYQLEYLDHSPTTKRNATGQLVNTMSISASDGNDATVSFGYIGKTVSNTTSQFSGATTPAAPTNDVIDTVTGIQQVTLDGTPDSEFLTSVSLELNNNAAPQTAIGQGLNAVGVSLGQLNVSAAIDLYFRNLDEITDYESRAKKTLSFALADSSNNAMIVTIPRGEWNSFQPTGSGLNGDSTASAQLSAERDPTTDCMIQIDMIPA